MQRIQRKRHGTNRDFALYSEDTQPVHLTLPMPANYPYHTWYHRLLRGIGKFFIAIIRKINQLLGFALAVLLLLLFTHFLLIFFGLKTSLFAEWVYFLSEPLLLPFRNLVPTLPFEGFIIDTTTLIAIIAYTLAILLVRHFLTVLVTQPSPYRQK